MRILTKEQKFQTDSEQAEIKIRVDTANPALIINLVSNMYSNPRRTLLTEYVQNAMDSHTLAGCAERPIQIQLPTELDLTFSVRDFGIGMSEKDIQEIFSRAFLSTKNQDNSMRGGFGIGKLVFGAYTGVMYIDIYDGQTNRNYLARLKDGHASIQPQYELDSTEERGVKISIPVRAEDVAYFRDTAKFIYSYLRVLPEIKDEPAFFAEIEKARASSLLFENPTHTARLYKRDKDANMYEHVVCVGELPFPLNFSELYTLARTEDQRQLVQFFQDQKTVVLYCEPGDVRVTPARDSLMYTPQSSASLFKILTDFRKFVLDTVQDKLSNFTTIPEAYTWVKNLYSTRVLSVAGTRALEFNGQSAVFDQLIDIGGNYYSNSRLSKYTLKGGHVWPIHGTKDFTYGFKDNTWLQEKEEEFYKLVQAVRGPTFRYGSRESNINHYEAPSTGFLILALRFLYCGLNPNNSNDVALSTAPIYVYGADTVQSTATTRIHQHSEPDGNGHRWYFGFQLRAGIKFKDLVDWCDSLGLDSATHLMEEVESLPIVKRASQPRLKGTSVKRVVRALPYTKNAAFVMDMTGTCNWYRGRNAWLDLPYDQMTALAADPKKFVVALRLYNWGPDLTYTEPTAKKTFNHINVHKLESVIVQKGHTLFSGTSDALDVLHQKCKNEGKELVVVGLTRRFNLKDWKGINFLTHVLEDLSEDLIKDVANSAAVFGKLTLDQAELYGHVASVQSEVAKLTARIRDPQLDPICTFLTESQDILFKNFKLDLPTLQTLKDFN